jgi:ElaB/YqjD/DUF883 family membrane-anchored ribosome-binding protein
MTAAWNRPKKEIAMSATLATGIAGNGAAGRAKPAVVNTPFEELFDGVDDLIRRVADVENPEIRKIRARVHASMVAAKGVAAKGAFDDGADQAGAQAVQVAHHADDSLNDYPGQVLGVALLVGLGLGLIVSSRE